MAGQDYISGMPIDVLEVILQNKCLSIRDVLDFARTCKRLHSAVIGNNSLWKTKFAQRFPSLQEAVEETVADSNGAIRGPVWIEELKNNTFCCKGLLNLLNYVAPVVEVNRKRLMEPMLNMKLVNPLFMLDNGVISPNYHYLTVKLMERINSEYLDDVDKESAYRIMCYLRETFLKQQWRKYTLGASKLHTVERGAILVAQWVKPEEQVSARKVSQMLDAIADQTRDTVALKYPHISWEFVPPSELQKWKTTNLTESHWYIDDANKIAKVLFDVIFHKLGFRENVEWPAYSCIDEVLTEKTGSPILLSIIFESVARRLGIHCQYVALTDVVLCWRDRQTKEESANRRSCYLVDGQFLTDDLPEVRDKYSKYTVIDTQSVIEDLPYSIDMSLVNYEKSWLGARYVRLLSMRRLRLALQGD